MKQLKQVFIVGYCLLASAAYAHTQLSSSVPANDAVVTVAPNEIVLTFSTEVRLTALAVIDQAGHEQTIEVLPTAAQRVIAVAVPALPLGQYAVSWRAVGADTHVVSGEFRFTVAAP